VKGRKVKIRLLSIIFVIIICLLIGIFNKLNSKTEINKNGTVERIGYKGEDRSYANTREQDTTPPVVEAYFEQRPRDDGKEGMMSRTVISSNEEIQPVEGWSLSRNKKTLTKIIDGYNENEKIIIKDLAGNETEIESRHYSAYVVYEQKEESVKVRITILREEIQEIEGWVWLDDIKCMEKSYYDGIEEKVAIRSREGESIVDIYVNTKMLQDKEPPVATVTYNKTELTNESVTATITANEEILAIGGWELAENGKELRKEYHENQVEKIAIIDLAGHIKIVEVKIDNIDKTPPIANVYYEQIEGTLRIAISANEEMQEVEGWTLSKNKKVLRKERNTGEVETVSIKDKVGNEIDVYTGNRKAMVTYFKENDMGAKVIIYNMHSRMQEVQGWVLSDNKMELVKNYTGEIEETEEKVEIKSETGEKIVDIYINTEDLKDKIPPVITLTYEQNATNGNIMVIITANEEIQGMGGWSIAENRKELRKEYHESKNEQVTVKDLAGNTKTVEIRVNIDRTPPTATVNYSSTEPTKENVVVTIIANEEIQEVEGWTLAENKQELSKEYQENKNEQVIIKDLQGNNRRKIHNKC